MNKAIVTIQGHQYFIQPGETLTLNGNVGDKGQKLTFNQVHLTVGDAIEVGTPELEISVSGTVKERTKSPKIKVATYKAKSRFRKVRGHRQTQTIIEIDAIGPAVKPAKSTPKKG
jgi:large subunit ribosomal protein L21